jgi:uncharacterized protein (TIGR03435 family)
MVALFLAAVTVIGARPVAVAQSAGFEVASIKPSNPNPTGPLGAVPMVLPALGRLTATNVTLKMLVVAAFQKQPFQIVGGPPWQNTDKFDINAKAEDGSLATDQLLERLKILLADRFKLKVHSETRDVPIYALVLAKADGKLGPKLTASSDDCPDFKQQRQQQLEALARGGLGALAAARGNPGEKRPCSVTPMPAGAGALGMKASGQSMELLTMMLTQLTGRPVIDNTRLTGLYDFELTIDLQTLMRLYADLGVNLPAIPPQAVPDGPSLMTQLQEDLGLKLDSQRGPGEVLVIDSAEHPTPD